MFTGIIQTLGQIQEIKRTQGDVRLQVVADGWDLASAGIGDSIAVNGVCLTVTELDANSFCADVSVETLTHTTLSQLDTGSAVNLEAAVRPSEPLGGHIVSGHVDGVGSIKALQTDARSTRFDISVPPELAKYIARKGSVTVDGVSLTVNTVDGRDFSVNIIPHTQQQTLFHSYRVGSPVNIEVDVVARYVERLLQCKESDAESTLSYQFLADNGFAD